MNKTNTIEDNIIFICDCNSYSHQAIFRYDEDDKQLSVSIHLVTYKNFFKRILSAIKYIFGYKCRYGEWDTFIFKLEDEYKLKEYLKNKK